MRCGPNRDWPNTRGGGQDPTVGARKRVADFRRILDDRAVDGLAIATPDHWHALATIHACAAGKHVLVEKPCSHNVIEAKRMLAAVRKTQPTGASRHAVPQQTRR